jgi:hemoglobin-like flavoprotein
MTPSQIRLVRTSFNKIEPIATQIGEAFYNKLFHMAPETRSLFKGDMAHQHAKFMSVVNELVSLHLRSLISLPVTLLNDSEAAMPAIHSLGARHAHWGIAPAHFDLMRKALMDTLGEVLGEEFTPQTREAWLAAFDLMASVMKKGLQNGEVKSSRFLERLPDADESAVKASADFFNTPVAPPPLREPSRPAASPQPQAQPQRKGPIRRFFSRFG